MLHAAGLVLFGGGGVVFVRGATDGMGWIGELMGWWTGGPVDWWIGELVNW